MGNLGKRRLIGVGFGRAAEIKLGILLTPSNHPQLPGENLIDRSRVSVQPINPHDNLGEGKRKRGRVHRDGLERLSQFCEGFRRFLDLKRCRAIDACMAVTPWSWFAPPVLACARAYPLAHTRSRTTMRSGKVFCLGKCPLSCCLRGFHRYRPETNAFPDDPTPHLVENRTWIVPPDPLAQRSRRASTPG
jgi:hypothetical protein